MSDCTNTPSSPRHSLTLIPPSPISEQITVDIRAAVSNPAGQPQTFDVAIYLDHVGPGTVLHRERATVPARARYGVYFRWPAKGHAGQRKIILAATCQGRTEQTVRPMEIVASDRRTVDRIGGAWTGFCHWSETEGRLWNADIQQMTDGQWRELVRAMHGVGMDIIVVQEVFRNQMYARKHAIETDGYKGRAFYPSKLYPGRMDMLAARDPVEAILSEADALGMHVVMGVGLYAWFDFSTGSLEWHKRVAAELWDMYGHHPSFYSFYVSEEVPGSLDNWDKDPEESQQRKRELVKFFREFKRYCRGLAPDKPIMLASNCHRVPAGLDTYPEFLQHLDILCPFGFARMPEGDLTGEASANLLQKLCDDSGSHLWMDMEVFLFDETGALYPRPIAGVISDLRRFPNFEKILCYQFPGLMNAPWMTRQPGGPDTVRLYEAYQSYLRP